MDRKVPIAIGVLGTRMDQEQTMENKIKSVKGKI